MSTLRTRVSIAILCIILSAMAIAAHASASEGNADVMYLSMFDLKGYVESQICTVSPTYTTPSRDLQFKGVNRWYNPNVESLEGFGADLISAKNVFHFTHLRFSFSQWYKLTDAELTATTKVIIGIFGSNIQPIIFDQGQLSELTESQAKQWVDICVSKCPNVAYWELINEPWDGSSIYKTQSEIDAYYMKIRNVATYLKSKISAPMTVGFHAGRMEAFNRLNDLCDIVAFHWYPSISILPAKTISEKSILYLLPGLFPMALQQARQQEYPAFPVAQTSDWLCDWVRVLNWVKTKANGRPYIINEWGFAVVKELENSQSYYCKQVLELLRHYQDPNFKGYFFYALREPYKNGLWSGILRYDRSVLPSAQWFP